MAFASTSPSSSAKHDMESKHRRTETGHALKRQIESSFSKQFQERTFQTIAFSNKKFKAKESIFQQNTVEFSESRSNKEVKLSRECFYCSLSNLCCC